MIQGISLLRNYPTDPACGRVLNVFWNFNVLINCDSAIFMRDAQNPVRLFDGQSVYQDRPAHAAIVWIIGSFLKLIGFPNQAREIIGNSGVATTYESVFYVSFLLLNIIILYAAVFLAIQYVTINNSKSNKTNSFNVKAITLLIVAANELTKTFFWTPHSQMFNVLLPVLALTMICNRNRINNLKSFLFSTLLVFGLMFFYPIFGILFSTLLFARYANLLRRFRLLLIFIILYLLYSKIISLIGGTYSNFQKDHYRQYVWVIDSIIKGDLQEKLVANIRLFFSTFPLFPSILVGLTVAFLLYVYAKSRRTTLEFKSNLLPYLFFLLLYIITLALMGFYSRRLTLGVYIYIELLLLKNSASILNERYQRTWYLATSMLILTLIGSWVWTNGPLA
jgi:hypothetical protein